MDKQNQSRLRLHTSLIPESINPSMPDENPKEKHRRKVGRKTKTASKKKKQIERMKKRPSASERLLRNTAIACALLLSIMAFKNIDSPFTNRITGAVREAVSMNLNLGESIGKMSFVQNFMPESALVFLNFGEKNEKPLPVSGDPVHVYSESQPWLEYLTQNEETVFALEDGTVTACVKTAHNDWTILIDHADESQTVYAYISAALVKTGDSVIKGAAIGKAGSNENARLYLEYRIAGMPSDPSDLMGRKGK